MSCFTSNSQTVTHQKALVVEGGAMRSVFSAGLLDGFLEQQFNPFDIFIGVSAGAFNLATYMAETPGKSINVFLDFGLNKNFINFYRFFRGGHLLDLDWMFETSTAEQYLDLNAVYRNGKPLIVCTTDVNTGAPVYINTTPANLKQAIKASSALPFLYRGFPKINGQPMTDGGISDGIPIAKAIELGAKRIMVVRSRHRDYVKKDTLGHRFIRWKLKHHSALTATMRGRVSRHQNVIDLIRQPPQDVTIVEVCPPENFSLGRFNRSKYLLQTGYQIGLKHANEAIHNWFANEAHNDNRLEHVQNH